MTITARKIVTKAMQKIGALVKTEDPDDDEANDGLDALNAMIASWSNDSLVLYARSWETFNLIGGQGVYTIGDTGDFNTVRPMNIIQGYIIIGGANYDIEVIDDETYNNITFPTLPSIPQYLNYDGGYPLGKIRIYPYPSSAYPLFLLTEKELPQFNTLDTEMVLPPGWERALIYNLALELAPEYNQKPDAYVIRVAADSLGLIRTNVAKVRGMDAYSQRGAVRNIYTGWRI